MQKHHLNACFRSAVILLACAAGAEGAVIVVDDDGGFDFRMLQAAVNAAADGDTVLVRDGDYERLVIDGKELTVIAEAGAKVTVIGPPDGSEHVVVRNLALSQQVVIRGIVVQPFTSAVERVIDLDNNQGGVWIEDVGVFSLGGTFVTGAALEPDAMVTADNCAAVHLTRTEILGIPGFVVEDSELSFLHKSSQGGDAMRADGSNVSIWDSQLTGGVGSTATFGPTDIPIPATDGGDGLEVRGGMAFLSGSSFTGGQGGGANPFFWGCLPAANGGTGLFLAASSPSVTSLESQFVGGAAGPAGVCSPSGLPGEALVIASGAHFPLAGFSRSLEITSPHREGETTTVSFTGRAGDLVFVAVGADQQYAALPGLRGVITLAPVSITQLGTLGPTGVLNVAAPIPAFLPAGVDAANILVQPLFVENPTTTPVIFAGSGSALTVLDASL